VDLDRSHNPMIDVYYQLKEKLFINFD